MMKAELEQVYKRMDKIEEEAIRRQHQNTPIRPSPRRVQPGAQGYDVEDEEELQELNEPLMNQVRFGRGYGNREARVDRPRQDDNLGSIKVKIPPFQYRNNPEAYLEWEKRMKMVFDCHNYFEIKK